MQFQCDYCKQVHDLEYDKVLRGYVMYSCPCRAGLPDAYPGPIIFRFGNDTLVTNTPPLWQVEEGGQVLEFEVGVEPD
jgi:hypothetical protein